MYSSIEIDSIPKNIVNAYNKVYPNSLTNKVFPDIIWFFSSRSKRQNYIQLDLAYEVGHYSDFKLTSIANQLDNCLTQEQCIYAYLSKFYFTGSCRGIKKTAHLFYNKNIEELNERECLELVIMTKNPSLYNKDRHQSELDKAVNMYVK